jgi:hypothetical protein
VLSGLGFRKRSGWPKPPGTVDSRVDSVGPSAGIATDVPGRSAGCGRHPPPVAQADPRRPSRNKARMIPPRGAPGGTRRSASMKAWRSDTGVREMAPAENGPLPRGSRESACGGPSKQEQDHGFLIN